MWIPYGVYPFSYKWLILPGLRSLGASSATAFGFRVGRGAQTREGEENRMRCKAGRFLGTGSDWTPVSLAVRPRTLRMHLQQPKVLNWYDSAFCKADWISTLGFLQLTLQTVCDTAQRFGPRYPFFTLPRYLRGIKTRETCIFSSYFLHLKHITVQNLKGY